MYSYLPMGVLRLKSLMSFDIHKAPGVEMVLLRRSFTVTRSEVLVLVSPG
jgi:hypothetical protein